MLEGSLRVDTIVDRVGDDRPTCLAKAADRSRHVRGGSDEQPDLLRLRLHESPGKDGILMRVPGLALEGYPSRFETDRFEHPLREVRLPHLTPRDQGASAAVDDRGVRIAMRQCHQADQPIAGAVEVDLLS